MLIKKYILIIITCCLFSLLISPQIKGDNPKINYIKVSIDSIPLTDSMSYNIFKLNIECQISNIDIKSQKPYFLKLGGIGKEVGANNIEVTIIDSDTIVNKNLYRWKQFNDIMNPEFGILFENDMQNIQINLKYSFIGAFDFHIRQQANHSKIIVYLSDREPWYPIKEDIKYDYVEINAPSNVLILFSAPEIKKQFLPKNRISYLYNIKQNTFEPYLLTVIDKASLLTDTLTINKKTILFRDIDTTSFNRFKKNKSEFRKLLLTLGNQIKLIPDSLTIMSMHWSNRGSNTERGYAIGRAIKTYILCDTSFISLVYMGFLHELQHIIYNYETNFKQPGKFFLGESIPEFLTRYYCEKYNPDKKYFKNEKLKFNKKIFSIEYHGTRTSEMIYDNGSDLLYNISLKAGTEKFVNQLIQLLNSKTNQVLTFSDFTQLLKDTGIPKQTCKKFERITRHYKTPKED